MVVSGIICYQARTFIPVIVAHLDSVVTAFYLKGQSALRNVRVCCPTELRALLLFIGAFILADANDKSSTTRAL
jgi:hypothetical protein